jgi:two-component system, NarL family, nitrate/nitrite response regulator NarL
MDLTDRLEGRPENSRIRVCLFSDQPILAKGLKTVLAATCQFRFVSYCADIADLTLNLERNAPDILLLDLTPDVTFSVLSDIKRAAPACKLVLWTSAVSTELYFQAIGLGVRGILRKNLSAEQQLECLLKVHAGELWFEKTLADSFMAARRVALSRREGELITLLSHGLKNKEIAGMLGISEGTVKVYLSRLFQKVGVKDRFELALFGLKNLTAGQPQKASRPDGAPETHLRTLIVERATLPVAEAFTPSRRAMRATAAE